MIIHVEDLEMFCDAGICENMVTEDPKCTEAGQTYISEDCTEGIYCLDYNEYETITCKGNIIYKQLDTRRFSSVSIPWHCPNFSCPLFMSPFGIYYYNQF